MKKEFLNYVAICYGKNSVASVSLPEYGSYYEELKDGNLYFYKNKVTSVYRTTSLNQNRISVYQLLGKDGFTRGKLYEIRDGYMIEPVTNVEEIENNSRFYQLKEGQVRPIYIKISTYVEEHLKKNISDDYKWKITICYGRKSFMEITAVESSEIENGVFENSAALKTYLRKNNMVFKKVDKLSYYARKTFIVDGKIRFHKHQARELGLNLNDNLLLYLAGNVLVVKGNNAKCFVTNKEIDSISDNKNLLTVSEETIEKLEVMRDRLPEIISREIIEENCKTIELLTKHAILVNEM